MVPLNTFGGGCGARRVEGRLSLLEEMQTILCMLIHICMAMFRCAPIADIAEIAIRIGSIVDYAHLPKLMHLSRPARAREILYSFHGWGPMAWGIGS